MNTQAKWRDVVVDGQRKITKQRKRGRSGCSMKSVLALFVILPLCYSLKPSVIAEMISELGTLRQELGQFRNVSMMCRNHCHCYSKQLVLFLQMNSGKELFFLFVRFFLNHLLKYVLLFLTGPRPNRVTNSIRATKKHVCQAGKFTIKFLFCWAKQVFHYRWLFHH